MVGGYPGTVPVLLQHRPEHQPLLGLSQCVGCGPCAPPSAPAWEPGGWSVPLGGPRAGYRQGALALLSGLRVGAWGSGWDNLSECLSLSLAGSRHPPPRTPPTAQSDYQPG